MTHRIPVALALTLALSGTVLATAASAGARISTGNLALDVQSAVGNDGNVNVSLRDGVATLIGNVDNPRVADTVLSMARDHEDVREIVDLMIAG